MPLRGCNTLHATCGTQRSKTDLPQRAQSSLRVDLAVGAPLEGRKSPGPKAPSFSKPNLPHGIDFTQGGVKCWSSTIPQTRDEIFCAALLKPEGNDVIAGRKSASSRSPPLILPLAYFVRHHQLHYIGSTHRYTSTGQYLIPKPLRPPSIRVFLCVVHKL